MMKISRKLTNKLVSYVDRYFTYDSRTMKREKTDSLFDFFGVCDGDGVRTVVVVDRMNSDLLWVSISKNHTCVHSGFLRSYDDITNFKKMVRCLG